LNSSRLSMDLIVQNFGAGHTKALRIAKRGSKSDGICGSDENSSPFRYKKSNIEAFKRKRRVE
jgi:hypothetical protein